MICVIRLTIFLSERCNSEIININIKREQQGLVFYCVFLIYNNIIHVPDLNFSTPIHQQLILIYI